MPVLAWGVTELCRRCHPLA